MINVYMQQALGNVLSKLSEKQPNFDSAIQCVRDIFAMNTKSLDQMARAGALHHMVHRKAAMADSGLNDSKDLRNHILNLPLSHEGSFGTGLEQKLKERQEINKQISDLLHEFSRGPKRTFQGPSDQAWKRPRYQEYDRAHGAYRQPQSYGPRSYKPTGRPQTHSYTGHRFP
ncbi:hypothetical protein DPMN_098150 [Dreissena polymorpha]|uniref:Uncharacterized protein n=1 Tax=Dreissena polymorpha TaxID=45954 RepID=A0A9D4LE58_DREPO|nr:hypothetical protein DPMN_098150 [Dreissena polymorpha]